MVVPQANGVHAEAANRPLCPAFPQATGEAQNCVNSWAQTATIPTNSVIDARAAASSTKIRNIAASLVQNIERTLFLLCSKSKRHQSCVLKTAPEVDRLVNGGRFWQELAVDFWSVADAALMPLFPEDRRPRSQAFPIEEFVIAGPGVDLGIANPAIKAAETLVLVFFPCRGVVHPAARAGEPFGRPNAVGHVETIR
jgi:hypothetical protein